MTDKKIKVIVAIHKEYRVADDPMYFPLQVGRALHDALPYPGDDTGENISEKNPNFCELTGLYWAWKNLDSEYIGLCHYRRYFADSRFLCRDPWKRVLRSEKAVQIMEKTPIILPRKRNYWIETNYSQYIHAHHAQDLEKARQVLERKYAEYLPIYDAYMEKTTGHRFNMLIMRSDILERYCQWLFDILFELEGQLDISDYTPYDQRVFGFVAERLLDVWIKTNNIPYTELPVMFMENQNWIKKGTAFVWRKVQGNFFGKCIWKA